MNIELLSKVAHAIDKVLSGPQTILGEIYNFDMNSFAFGKGDPHKRKQLEELLASSLAKAAQQIAICLELLGLLETRTAFLKECPQNLSLVFSVYSK